MTSEVHSAEVNTDTKPSPSNIATACEIGPTWGSHDHPICYWIPFWPWYGLSCLRVTDFRSCRAPQWNRSFACARRLTVRAERNKTCPPVTKTVASTKLFLRLEIMMRMMRGRVYADKSWWTWPAGKVLATYVRERTRKHLGWRLTFSQWSTDHVFWCERVHWGHWIFHHSWLHIWMLLVMAVLCLPFRYVSSYVTAVFF